MPRAKYLGQITDNLLLLDYYAALLIAIVQVKAYIFGKIVSTLLADVQHYLLFLIAIMGMWMVLEKWRASEKKEKDGGTHRENAGTFLRRSRDSVAWYRGSQRDNKLALKFFHSAYHI